MKSVDTKNASRLGEGGKREDRKEDIQTESLRERSTKGEGEGRGAERGWGGEWV